MPNFMDFSITPVKDPNGEVKFLIPEGRNITDLRIAELKRIESEAKYRSLFDLSLNAMLLLENEVIIECNEAALKMLGYKKVLEGGTTIEEVARATFEEA